MTLTVASRPTGQLADAWNDLDTLLRELTKGAWLARRVDGYARVTEVTLSAGGWHPHAHLVLISRNEMTRTEAQKLAVAIRDRWLSLARAHGIKASPEAQDVRLAQGPGVRAAVAYLAKGRTDRPFGKPGTSTPADLLRGVYAGDADALEHWLELEAAGARRRKWAASGAMKFPASK